MILRTLLISILIFTCCVESASIENKKYKTKPYLDQKAGTSGLRKTIKTFEQDSYLENYIQSYFDTLDIDQIFFKSLVLGSDGRYYSGEAVQMVIRLAAAKGFDKIYVGENGLLSTPAASHLIRELNRKEPGSCTGGIVLTASHNPGGPDGDFGIKIDMPDGGPAPENVTNQIFEESKKIKVYKLAILDIIKTGYPGTIQKQKMKTFKHVFKIETVSSVKQYVEYMKTLFDFEAIRKLVSRKDFAMAFDGMSGVSGIYAKEIFLNELGVSPSSLFKCDPLPDFGGVHPDPILKHADKLRDLMGVSPNGQSSHAKVAPDFGAACDGDADRSMILGHGIFVTPSDSLAVIAANAHVIPGLKKLKGVARSMPTSCAVDVVAKKLGIDAYETPTGWKYFQNLLNAGKINLCGEESFGAGSDHIREKDGLWTVLAWLSILADKNKDSKINELVTVEKIMNEHWSKFGRNYYTRYDYENLDPEKSKKVFETLESKFEKFKQEREGNMADIYNYTDPIDKSQANNEGLRFISQDGSRFIYRHSGTGSSNATVRLYIEKYDKEDPLGDSSTKLKSLTEKALEY